MAHNQQELVQFSPSAPHNNQPSSSEEMEDQCHTFIHFCFEHMKCSTLYHILVLTLLLYCTVAVSYLWSQRSSTTVPVHPTAAPAESNNIQTKCNCNSSTIGDDLNELQEWFIALNLSIAELKNSKVSVDAMETLNDTILSLFDETATLHQTDMSQLQLSISAMNNSWKNELLDVNTVVAFISL
eukprot:99749_1